MMDINGRSLKKIIKRLNINVNRRKFKKGENINFNRFNIIQIGRDEDKGSMHTKCMLDLVGLLLHIFQYISSNFSFLSLPFSQYIILLLFFS